MLWNYLEPLGQKKNLGDASGAGNLERSWASSGIQCLLRWTPCKRGAAISRCPPCWGGPCHVGVLPGRQESVNNWPTTTQNSAEGHSRTSFWGPGSIAGNDERNGSVQLHCTYLDLNTRRLPGAFGQQFLGQDHYIAIGSSTREKAREELCEKLHQRPGLMLKVACSTFPWGAKYSSMYLGFYQYGVLDLMNPY